ncbi:MAG: hypothetical protein AB1651_13700 [Pseudomonadota bacterium]
MIPEPQLQSLRRQAAGLLEQSTDDLDAAALYALVRTGIERELQKRQQTHGGSAILVLNGLLAIERQMREQALNAA